MVDVNDVVERTLDADALKRLITGLAEGSINNSQYVTLQLFKIIEAAEQELQEQNLEERRGSGAW